MPIKKKHQDAKATTGQKGGKNKILTGDSKAAVTQKRSKGAEGKALSRGAESGVLTFRQAKGTRQRGGDKTAGFKAAGRTGGVAWTGKVRPERFAVTEEEFGIGPAESKLRDAFARRVSEWGLGMAESAPEEVLAEALGRMNARGAILHVMELIPSDEEKSEAALLEERAVQRALAVREELAHEAGGMKTTQEVAERLGVTRQSVDRYRREGKLLSLETPQGHVFPACQIGPDGMVPGLDEVLAEMGGLSFWEALSGLVTPTPTLNNRSVLDALKTTRPSERQKIREVVRDYATA